MLGCYLMPHPPIIIPEVGKGREAEVIKTVEACKTVGEKIKVKDADTVIIVTPHGTVFRDVVAMVTSQTLSGSLAQFGAPSVKFNEEIDIDLTMRIIKYADESGVAVANLDQVTAERYGVDLTLDHGVMVPLYFLEKEKYHKIVHITYGMLSPIELLKFGNCIQKAVKDSGTKAVFIASGDLSHRLTQDGPYPYSPLGIKFDKELMSILSNGQIDKLFSIDRKLIKEAGECGLRSLYILAGVLNTARVEAHLLSYEGPLGVGYGVIEFEGAGTDLYKHIVLEKEHEHKRRIKEGNPYTKLARANLESYFTNGTLLTVDDVEDSKLLKDRKGVFVSLKINGDLRGCIGTIAPATDSVAEEIIRNSISAAVNDPRFSPVTYDELKEIDISVDLLYPPEPTEFDGLDPKRYGVIVSYGQKRGLLLPHLEGVDTAEEQVSIAREKGNIPSSANYTLERFKVERFKEVEGDD